MTTDAEIDAHLARTSWGWSDAEIDAWNQAATCTHDGFHALDHPKRPMDTCPDCDAVLRTLPTPQSDRDTRAENRRDQDNYEYAQLMLREESF